MGKGLKTLFETVVNKLSVELPIFGESGSEISYLIPEPRKFAKFIRLLEDTRKHWLKATLKDIQNLINHQKLLVDDPEKGEPVTPCMYVYKEKSKMMEFLTS